MFVLEHTSWKLCIEVNRHVDSQYRSRPIDRDSQHLKSISQFQYKLHLPFVSSRILDSYVNFHSPLSKTFLMCNNFCQNLGSSLSRVLSPSPRFTSTSTHNNNFHQNSPHWLFLSYSWKYVGLLSEKVVVQFFSIVIKISTETAVF